MGLHRAQARRTLHRKDVIAKCNEIKRSAEYRLKISRVMKEKLGKMLSARAKQQWEDPAYKKFMADKFREFYRANAGYRKVNNAMLDRAQKEYWSRRENRAKQANRVKKYFIGSFA